MGAFFRFAIVVIFAVGIVLIGAEELRRKTKKIPVTQAERQRMMQKLNPEVDFRKEKLAEEMKQKEQKVQEEENSARAQIKPEETEATKEKLDPTDLRALINRLLR